MKLMDHLAKDNPPLVKKDVQVPAPASGNANSVTFDHGFTDHTGRSVAPEVVIPVVRGESSEAREIHVYVVSVTETQVTLRAVTSETTMTAVNVTVYMG